MLNKRFENYNNIILNFVASFKKNRKRFGQLYM